MFNTMKCVSLKTLRLLALSHQSVNVMKVFRVQLLPFQNHLYRTVDGLRTVIYYFLLPVQTNLSELDPVFQLVDSVIQYQYNVGMDSEN